MATAALAQEPNPRSKDCTMPMIEGGSREMWRAASAHRVHLEPPGAWNTRAAISIGSRDPKLQHDGKVVFVGVPLLAVTTLRGV